MFIILPKRFFIIGIIAARHILKQERKFVFKTSSNCSSVIRISNVSLVMPALLIKMSILPARAIVSATNSDAPLSDAKSHGILIYSSLNSAFIFSILRPDTTTVAPAARIVFAIATPIPPVAPVIKATRPDKSNILYLQFLCGYFICYT